MITRSRGPCHRAARIALAVLAAAALLACDRGRVPRTQRLPHVDDLRPIDSARTPRYVNYQISATLDPARHLVNATEVLKWTNYSARPQRSLPFHLYLNAFKNESSLFMKSSHGKHRGATASDNWGYIDVASIRIHGDEVRQQAHFDNGDETVMWLALPTPLAPGETIEISMRFTAQLPEVFARTGYKGYFHMVAQWFPKIGVLTGPPESTKWDCRPFDALAEFFADFGTYDVDITVPDAYVVAATGVLVSAESDASRGMRTLRYRAEDVHDFAWMADPYMVRLSGTI
jgi:hypothetical protein